MAHLLCLAPLPVSVLSVSRGSGEQNLLTVNPKEVWADSAAGSAAQINIDLGSVRAVDTVFLGHVTGPHSGAVWTIQGGATGYTQQTLKASGALRAVDSTGQAPEQSHGLWTGAAVNVRYLRISVTQTAGHPPLRIGTLMVGAAFTAELNIGWGAGRRVIDTGTARELPDGGFATVEGARKGSFSWSFMDLSREETDALYDIQLQCGETLPVLVVEDPEATTGQLHRIHYSKFTSLKKYDRRNAKQIRWEMSVVQWL